MPRYKTFYGSRSCNTCAWCWKHHLSLTPQQLRQRGCLQRECKALKRFEEHPLWAQREEKKALRRERKARLEEKYLEVTRGHIRL